MRLRTTLSIDKADLDYIDQIAKKVNRKRSNFLIWAAKEKAKEIEDK
jgi:hypothetical protein